MIWWEGSRKEGTLADQLIRYFGRVLLGVKANAVYFSRVAQWTRYDW